MSATISLSHDKLLNELLSAGRFRNKSEIIRRGLELVRQEVQADSLQPLSAAEMSAACSQMDETDRAADESMSRASVRPAKGEL